MHCDKCGAYNPDDNYYCDKCGKQLIHKIPTDPYRNLTIGECIKEYFKKYFVASGVASIKEFIVMLIINVAMILLLTFLVSPSASTAYLLLNFFPMMTLSCRRLHDTNKSGAYCTILGYGFIAYMFRAFMAKEYMVILMWSTAIISFIISLILLTKPTDPNSRWNPVNGYRD